MIQDASNALDFIGNELNSTHWVIKNVDLLDKLNDLGVNSDSLNLVL